MPQTVGIVGAGIAGRLTALECVKRDMHVTVFDENKLSSNNSAAHAAAGMLSPTCELADAGELVYRLGLRSMQLWPTIVRRVGDELFFKRDGSLIVAHHHDADELVHLAQRIEGKLLKMGVSSSEIEYVSASRINALEPELWPRFCAGIFVRSEGQIDNRQILDALAKYVIAAGTHWRESVRVNGVKPYTVHCQEGTFKFDHVIDCRGLGANVDLAKLRGVRGELLAVYCPSVKLSRPVRLLHARSQIYVVPRQDSMYLVGATQIESMDRSPISVQSCLELLSSAVALSPNFVHGTIIETRVQCRPAFSDNLPKIIRQPGLISVNGLFRHGFLCSPAIAEAAVAMLQEQQLPSEFEGLATEGVALATC